ncbi:undecaprenyl/decaprenyl-phosphate alpha-N-acetylglucosaminyl 1-phosphate transferase [Hanstruepera neustonica]|uniref:Undecaprenyl/decaprenyl-phosphate alpha-N-acetylglucosaminyl 1-phosphate transferase n=1 Tax=Hanstruepera neustonica TaxID=1445657 RepID=A0A2K1DZ25_9FLAO|nr:MraY family glycosyltransferase [Hanstruepera neustonica]PNQ73276.1 undecaprenyl/decaprenyl-phosphate alpha-N-acetylglucosaminyl 1-phosphate transferase [Hanstruepera neustonica]
MIESLINIFNPEEHIIVWLISAFIMAFFIAYNTFPTILYVAKEKHLLDEPDDRSTHSYKVPTLGGIGIFISLVVVMTITGAFLNTKVLLLVMGAITILFFLGLKDDLTVLSARKKFMGQLFAALLLIVFTDTRIIGFSKILDVETLPYWVSIGFTLFVYILIINAYNLIDGVDGLAGAFAFFASAVFSILFIKADMISLATIAIALMGALIAFLRLNFSNKNKLFMGDTGSMIVGFLLAFFTISFISEAQLNVNSQYHKASPALAIAILFFPLIDTLRVVLVRLLILKSNPFKPDKKHIHHCLLNMGFSHVMTTTIIIVINVAIIGIAFNLLHLNLNTQIALLLFYGSLLYVLPFVLLRGKLKAEIGT